MISRDGTLSHSCSQISGLLTSEDRAPNRLDNTETMRSSEKFRKLEGIKGNWMRKWVRKWTVSQKWLHEPGVACVDAYGHFDFCACTSTIATSDIQILLIRVLVLLARRELNSKMLRDWETLLLEMDFSM